MLLNRSSRDCGRHGVACPWDKSQRDSRRTRLQRSLVTLPRIRGESADGYRSGSQRQRMRMGGGSADIAIRTHQGGNGSAQRDLKGNLLTLVGALRH